MRAKYRWLRRIESLDPIEDHQEIYRLSMGHEFPWDYARALEFALFRTYCVPGILALLARTGEFRDRPQKRYDDTALLMLELVVNGYDSPRGREALRVVNRQHGRYAIGNDEMRYVLSTFIYDPIDWIDRYGWRPLSAHERIAGFEFYRQVGRRMGIRDIPGTYEEFRDFKTGYEAAHFAVAASNTEIGNYTVNLFASWFPAPLRPAARKGVLALLDPPMLAAFGFPPPPRALTRTAHLALRGRARFVRLLPPRRQSTFDREDLRNRTYPGYPKGYRPADLGAG